MTENHGKRIAVIQNEFGAQTGIEEAMVMNKDGNQAMEWLELPNGCICCSVRSVLVRAVEYLVDRSDSFEYVLVETDGLARPGPVAAAFWVDDELDSALYLDGIITVVDSKNVLQHLNENKETNEAQQQIAISDCILINKVDLVDEDHLNALEDRIHQLNDCATCHRTCNAKIDLNLILDIHAYDQSRALDIDKELESIVKQKKGQTCSEDHTHSEICASKARSSHLNDVTTICLIQEKPMDQKKLVHWLGKLLWESETKKADILRMKGVLNIGNDECRFALQGVHDIFDLSRTDVPWNDSERISKVVFIGRNLNEEFLTKGFNNCLFTQ